MRSNISKTQRLIRTLIAVGLLIYAMVISTPPNYWVGSAGVIILLTALTGFCPIDHYFHMKRPPK